MRTVIVTCDHCGEEIDDKEVRRSDNEDYCKKCYGEKDALNVICCRLGECLSERWEKGGLDLTSKGVADILYVSDIGDVSTRRFALGTLTFVPLDSLIAGGDIEIGPYSFKSRRGEEDDKGSDGYDIFREGKQVAVIRRREHKGGIRFDYAFALDKSQPGQLLWNSAEADYVTDIGEAIQLALSSLERHYNEWVENLGDQNWLEK